MLLVLPDLWRLKLCYVHLLGYLFCSYRAQKFINQLSTECLKQYVIPPSRPQHRLKQTIELLVSAMHILAELLKAGQVGAGLSWSLSRQVILVLL